MKIVKSIVGGIALTTHVMSMEVAESQQDQIGLYNVPSDVIVAHVLPNSTTKSMSSYSMVCTKFAKEFDTYLNENSCRAVLVMQDLIDHQFNINLMLFKNPKASNSPSFPIQIKKIVPTTRPVTESDKKKDGLQRGNNRVIGAKGKGIHRAECVRRTGPFYGLEINDPHGIYKALKNKKIYVHFNTIHEDDNGNRYIDLKDNGIFAKSSY